MKDFVGNSATIKYLEQAVAKNNLTHAYLFCGPENVGKTKAGQYFAKLLLCESENPLNCSGCPSCTFLESGNHPDFFHFDQETVSVDEIRELIGSLELKSYRGKGRVVLLSHAEKLTNQALNSFLKTLEEPNSHTTIILTTENRKNLLPTIVSRTQAVNFSLVDDKRIYELLNNDLGVKKDDALRVTALASGRAGAAVALSEHTDSIEEVARLVADFNRIYKSQDIYEKIAYADKLSKEKDSLAGSLQQLELAARGELMKQMVNSYDKLKINELIGMLDGLVRSREMIAGNANAKLVMEGLLLGSMA